MNSEWIKEPPHPETEWAACTNYFEQAELLKPAADSPLQAASVCAGPESMFYMTGVNGEDLERQTVRLWSSRDLKEWNTAGAASITGLPSQAGEQLVLSSIRLHYVRGIFWLACGLAQGGTGLLKSETGSVDGTYSWQCFMTTDGNDASLFEDEDGAVYWVYGHGKIARMKDDFSGLAELPYDIKVAEWLPFAKRKLTEKQKPLGTHGAFLFKSEGLYFLFAAESFKRMGSDGTDTFVSVSESVYGPYSRRYLAIPHGGAATLFRHGDGGIYAAFSGCGSYSAVEGRPAVIQMTQPWRECIRPPAELLLERGQVAALKPRGDMLIRDPQISLGPDGLYVLTGTRNFPHESFWDGNDELHLWTSPDLVEWTHTAKVWDLRTNGTWENNTRNQPSLWAPETIYTKGTYWITYSVQGGGTSLLKSSSGKLEGPYIDMGRMTNTHIDSSLFEDEDGQLYYVWQNGRIARMKPNMSGFADDPRLLLPVDGQQVGYEGAFIIKYKGKYILGAAEWNGDRRVEGTYDMMYSVSDNLYGPYCPRRTAVPHGGHGTLFIDKDGRLMATLFGNDRTAPFRTRLGIVTMNVIDDGGDLIIQPE
jgi:beta-xylosidase